MKKNLLISVLATSLTTIFSVAYAQDSENLLLGNPSKAVSDTTKADNYLMVKPQYCLSYNNSKHIPNWVSWHVCNKDLDTCKKQTNFTKDNTLPVSFYHVTPEDYSKTGFDKGNLCPPTDRTNNTENNAATFLMTNTVPQAPNNNRIVWDHLEGYCRKLVDMGNELYIICGTSGQGGEGSNGFALEIKHNVSVPMQLWKIIVVLPNGDNDLSRIDANTRVIAVLIPNNQECSQQNWGSYRVSVAELEKLTYYDFLSNVPKNIQKIIKDKIDNGSIIN